MSDQKKFDRRNFILNEKVSAPKYYFGDSFKMDSGLGNVWDYACFDGEILERCIDAYGLGDKTIRCPQGAREWGYHFFQAPDILSGDGVRAGGGGFAVLPKDRKEALRMLQEGVRKLYGLDGMTDWETCPGHFKWQHYACEMGCTSVCAEVGESISSTQTHIAFCRGAAKQFGLPWALQFSFWQRGRINDYTGTAVWGVCSQEKGGHSPSLYTRTAVAGYMGGMSHFYPEAGIVIDYLNELDGNGLYKLSPVGKASEKLNCFFRRNSDVGIHYVPFGILLDRYHGMCPGDWRIGKQKVFQVFDMEPGDRMNYDLFDKFFPGSWVTFDNKESTYMVNSPYGDTCDALLQTASLDVFKSYPCIIPSGCITFSQEEIERLTQYVRQGGTLILNAAYVEQFPQYEKYYTERPRTDIEDGRGRVIIYGGFYQLHNLDSILREQLRRLIPFEIPERVEYLVNVKENALILTLINNDGYYYHHTDGVDIDYTGTKNFVCRYTGDQTVTRVRELWNDTEAAPTPAQAVQLSPGEIKIFEFGF